MSEWVTGKLGDIAELSKKTLSIKHNKLVIKYLDTGNITQNKIDEIKLINCKTDKQPSRAKKIVENGDIIYSTVRPIQKHYGYINDKRNDLIVSTGFAVLKANEKGCGKYIYYFLSDTEVVEYLANIAEDSVTAYPSIKPSVLETIDIEIPPLEEQKEIADILSSFDDKIDLLNRQNKTLEDLASTYFRQWFIEEKHDDWEEKTIGEIAYQSKKTCNPLKNTEVNYNVFSLPAFDNNKIPEKLNGKEILSNKFILDKECILFSKLNPRNPRIWYLKDIKDNFVCSTEFIVVNSIKNEYLSYIYFLLKSKYFIGFMTMSSSGTSGSHQRIQPNYIFDYAILFDETRIIEFDKLVKPFLIQIFKNEKQIQTLTKLRDTLLPKLINGEVRVK